MSTAPVCCEAIPYIDDSGSSSCASSLQGEDHKGMGAGDDDDDDDATSLSRLLDDAASRELSFNGLHDDLASLSCGYASLDARSDVCSDGRSEGGTGRKDRSKACRSSQEDESAYPPSSSAHSSPRSHRTSHSSLKSSDALDDDVIDYDLMLGSERPPPSFPPPLPPCATCEDSSCCSSDSSSVMSCTLCDQKNNSRRGGGEVKTSTEGDDLSEGKKKSSLSSEEGEDKVSPSSLSTSFNTQIIITDIGQTTSLSQSSISSNNVATESTEEATTNLLSTHPVANESEVRSQLEPSEGSGGPDIPISRVSFAQTDSDQVEWSMEESDPNSFAATDPKDICNDSTMPMQPSTPNCLMPNGSTRLSIGNRLSMHETLTPSTEFGPPFDASTPNSAGPSTGSTIPHHYISTLRVSSMRGSTDMGGALVARVATFLRSQYKSFVSSPVLLSWCPRFKLLVSEFETSLVQIPLAPHLKVPPGPATISSLLKPHVQVSFNESVVEDRPRRVLVEGEAGYCNSNICFRMAYDWAVSPPESYLSGFSLVFVLTLRDFKGGSLFSYMCKEILPRHILSREAMNTLWTHLRKIEDKVLYLLVGYDELNEDETGDLSELIDGQTFPNSSVIMTSRSGACKIIPSSLHRRFLITGLNHTQTTLFIQKYFASLGKPDCGSEVMSLVTASQEKYGELPRCPVMCLALGVLYEDFGGKLPSRLTDLFMALIKHMVRKNLLRRGEPMCYGVLPDRYTVLFQDFGKLALESLKAGNPYFTGTDLKTKVQHGGEIVSLGILVRMRSMSKLNKKEYYAPSHISILEFIAAFYISSLIHNCASLQNELDSLAEALDLTNIAARNCSGIMILRYLVGILGRNAYVAFNILSQMGISHRLLFLLLGESGMSQMNVIEVCKHVAGREHVVIQTNSLELEDWGRLLYSPDCSLEGVEVLLDFDGSSRDRHESFFTCLSFNESVKSIKLTCIIGGEFGEIEVTRLVSYVRTVLTKRRLESFEMVVTSLEDSTAEVLSPVVDMICDTLPELAQALTKLVIAMELEGDQVLRLCEVLKAAPQVKVLHLPHLACGLEGLNAVAQLLQTNPLVSLNLTGSLSSGTPIDERSAWTGSSTPSPSKEEASPLSFWSFVDAQGNTRSVFNSLPRSFYQSIPRRGRIHSNSNEKRNSDTTLLQKSCFPPPTCSLPVHQNGFHEIFSAFRSVSCRVCHLNISKCTLGAEDLVCLGETIRFTKCLSSLRMEGLSRMAELIPVLIALQENKSLQLLDLTSPHILLGDAAFQVLLNSLGKNNSLRFLVLNGWTLQLESERSLHDFMTFLSSTELQHLDLTGCRVMVVVNDGPLGKLSRQDNVLAVLQEGVKPLKNNSLAFLNLDNFEVHVNGKVILRGPQLFFLLRHLPKLVDITLGSNLGSDVLDDASSLRIFSLLPTAFPCLKRLSISGWIFSLDNCEKVMRACGKYLRRSQVREIHLGGVQVRESSGKAEMEHHLLSAFTSNLHHLSLISLSGLNLSHAQIAIFGKVLRDKLVTSSLEIETRGMSYSSIKALRQAVLEGGKCHFQFEGGPASVYHLKKVDRREKMLGKWACMSSLEKYTDL